LFEFYLKKEKFWVLIFWIFYMKMMKVDEKERIMKLMEAKMKK
jgi:hypothetical protein